MARSSDRLWLKGSPVELPRNGGTEGTGGNYPGTRDREAGPPPVRRYLDAFKALSLTLGCEYTMSRPTTTIPRAEQREEAAREDPVDLRHRRTQVRLRGARGRFFLAVSPFTWKTSALRIAA